MKYQILILKLKEELNLKNYATFTSIQNSTTKFH